MSNDDYIQLLSWPNVNEWRDNRPDFIIGGRKTGKTTLLIKQAYEDAHSIIVCSRKHMADYIHCMAMRMGCPINRPIIYDKFFRYHHEIIDQRNLNCYFDDYGMRLEDVLRREINRMELDHVKTIMINEDSIGQINDILSGLKIQDMDGNELQLKVQVCEEEKE